MMRRNMTGRNKMDSGEDQKIVPKVLQLGGTMCKTQIAREVDTFAMEKPVATVYSFYM